MMYYKLLNRLTLLKQHLSHRLLTEEYLTLRRQMRLNLQCQMSEPSLIQQLKHYIAYQQRLLEARWSSFRKEFRL